MREGKHKRITVCKGIGSAGEGDRSSVFVAQSQEVAKAYTAACTPDFYVFKKVRKHEAGGGNEKASEASSRHNDDVGVETDGTDAEGGWE